MCQAVGLWRNGRLGRSLVVPQGEGDSNNQLEQQQQQQQSLSPILKKYQNWRSKEGSGRRRRGGEEGGVE